MFFDESFTPNSAPSGPPQPSDFPASLYPDGPPPPDQEAIDQAAEKAEADQPGPAPTAEEVVDETAGQTLREVEADESKLAEEAEREHYPDVDGQ
jgi:hypothetical protein